MKGWHNMAQRNYVINGEKLQELIMNDLYFMHYYYHEYTQNEEGWKEVAFSNYRRNRALLRRMLHIQGLTKEESLMVRGYLRDLKDVILNGTYKMR